MLDGPPPNPVNGPAGQPPAGGGFGGLGGANPVGSPQGDQNALKAVVSMGADIDRAVSGLAQATGGSDELMQAKQLIQAHLAKWLAAGPGALSASPTAPGPQFPGASPSGPPQ
jgi:hypothetical protein